MTKRKFNESAYVNRGVDANRSEFLDEEGARECAEGHQMADRAHMVSMVAAALARGENPVDFQVTSWEELQGYRKLMADLECKLTPTVADSSGARFGALFQEGDFVRQLRLIWSRV